MIDSSDENLMELRVEHEEDPIVNGLIDLVILFKGQAEELMRFIRTLNAEIDELKGDDDDTDL